MSRSKLERYLIENLGLPHFVLNDNTYGPTDYEADAT